MQALAEVKALALQTTETAGQLDELIEAVEKATAERDLARKQLLVLPAGLQSSAEEEDTVAQVAAITRRLREVEARASTAQQETESATAELQELQLRCRTDREAAAKDLSDAQADFQQALRDVKEIAGSKAKAAAEDEAAKLQAELQARLDQQSAELDTAQQQVRALEESVAQASSLASDRDAAIQEVDSLHSKLEAAQAELSRARAAQLSAETAARDAEKAMSERQKRFQHVHAKLKKDEDALKARVERFEAEAAGYGEQIGAALSQADAAVQARDGLLRRAEQAESQAASQARELEAAQSALSSAQQASATAAAALDSILEQHSAQMLQLRADLHSAQEQQHAQSQHATDEQVREQVAARLAEREAELLKLQDEAAAAIKAAEASIAEAQQRADSAELAKIELSLRLAEIAADRDTDLPEPSPVKQQAASSAEPLGLQPLDSEPGLLLEAAEVDALQKRVEEAELAASVGARRAAAAEGEVSVLKCQLQAAEKKLKELAWQIKMISDPQQIGGRGSQQAAAGNAAAGSQPQSGRVNNILDMFGCGANYTRR
ncbi:hypothetical protein WJX84_011721 [Apatococcus fuscideae]|uniref:Uncharacterized protein n=1 Tax=Apatococcus fuscideae TaxID=2026836 RepID=A0AAW1SIL9_9CHLO